jgi:hypothetical protein
MASTYNVSPTPTAGTNAFGLVPGQTALPPSIWDELNQNVPNYGALTSSATGDISSMLGGQISPTTQSNIWNSAAARGVSLGQPDSPISDEIGLGLTGQTSEGLQQQGVGDYNTLTGTLGSEQQNPALMADISQSNANLAAAPSPEAAANYAQSLYQQYMQMMNPAGGSSFSMNTPSNVYSQFPSQGGGGSSYQNYQNLVAGNEYGGGGGYSDAGGSVYFM